MAADEGGQIKGSCYVLLTLFEEVYTLPMTPDLPCPRSQWGESSSWLTTFYIGNVEEKCSRVQTNQSIAAPRRYMSTNSIHLNVHSYVYFKIPQNISCSILHLMSFKVSCGWIYNKSQKRSSQNIDQWQTITVFIYIGLFGLSVSVLVLWLCAYFGWLSFLVN